MSVSTFVPERPHPCGDEPNPVSKYARCTKILRIQGLAYSEVCEVCGDGKCQLPMPTCPNCVNGKCVYKCTSNVKR
jgi:hypothetical protein